MLIFGADVSNAFGEAPPPKQGFFIRPDQAFRDWWNSKGDRDPIPDRWVIPVLAAMQGHPESSRRWEKHVDRILRRILAFTPTVHEPCLYKGIVDGARVLFKRQVDDFALAAALFETATRVFDMLDSQLRIPMRRMGLITMYNGLDIQQSRYFVKIYIKTWLNLMLQPYFETWLDIPDTKYPVPLGTNESFIKRLYNAVGDPDTDVQAKLEKAMGFKFRKAVGQLIWPMSTCRPDIAQPVVYLHCQGRNNGWSLAKGDTFYVSDAFGFIPLRFFKLIGSWGGLQIHTTQVYLDLVLHMTHLDYSR
jgi:hypothetical protein